MVMQFEYPRNALLDLSPINDAIDFRAKQQQRAKDNQFRDEQLGMQKERFGLEKQGMEDARQRAFVQKAAGIAQMISQEKDPNVASARWGQLVNSDPRWGNALKASGVDPNDFRTGAQMIIAEARGYQDPLDAEKMQAQIGLVRAQTNLANAQAAKQENPDQAFRQREAEADRQGLQGPARQAYILTGKMPREDQQPLTATDKKAILEADEAVMTTQNAIASLERARQLSKTAYEGATANERAWVMSQFGDAAANDTRELKQTVTEGALQQLKAIFGGMPTEGERKVLLEVQGSAELPAAVREKIYERAIQLANSRLAFNRQRAEQMRGGTYYKAQPGPQQAPASSSGQGAGGWSIKRLD